MAEKLKRLTIKIVVIMLVGFMMFTYKESGWTLVVIINLLVFLAYIIGFWICHYFESKMTKHHWQPTFPFIVLAFFLYFVLGITDLHLASPLTLNVTDLQEKPLTEFISLLASALIHFSLYFMAISIERKPDTRNGN